MSNTDEKIKVIDEIVTKHPSYGVDKGWGYYVGGMKDSGDWYFRKMLNVPIEELKSFLNGIIEQENKAKVPKVYTEEEKKDMNTWHNDNGFVYNEYHAKQWAKLHREIELKIIWGVR